MKTFFSLDGFRLRRSPRAALRNQVQQVDTLEPIITPRPLFGSAYYYSTYGFRMDDVVRSDSEQTLASGTMKIE